MKKIVTAIVILIVASTVWLAWETLVFLNQSAGRSQTEVFFEVKPGDSASVVARKLEREGLISDQLRFRLLMKFQKKPVRVGEYSLNSKLYPMEVFSRITSGRSVQHSFTIQEGLNIFEIATLYEKKGLGRKEAFLKQAQSASFMKELLGSIVEDRQIKSLEGYLFPETYNLTKYTKVETLIRKMVNQFRRVYSEIKGRSQVDLDMHEVVTLASVIEKETGAPEERPLISSVYHNRLNKPMRMQADPTVLYGIWVETGEFKKNLTKKDLQTPTPYNTYRKGGLPYGPIANPGKEALLAALRPEKSDFFFFVSRNDGTHIFSTNYDAHREAVRKFQLNRKAREGRSWRDLGKRQKNKASSAQ